MSREADPCADWQEDLSALLDGELDRERRAEVRAHLEGCTRCSARLGALRRVDDLLAAAPLPDLPDGLVERVLRRVAAPGRSVSPRPRLGAPAVAALAAAAALALYLAFRPRPESGLPAAPARTLAEEPAEPRGSTETPMEEGPPPTLITEPLPPPALPPPPEPEIPRFELQLEAPQPLLAGVEPERAPDAAPAEVDLEAEAPEDLAVVLFGAESPDDFDVISNLELLERLVALERGRG